jgi:hypothetical protein
LKKSDRRAADGTTDFSVLQNQFRGKSDKIDCGLNLRQFELVQTGYDAVVLVAPDDIDGKEREAARDKVAQLLAVITGYPVTVDRPSGYLGVCWAASVGGLFNSILCCMIATDSQRPPS